MSAQSAQQLVFEGPDPERLLLEAWSVHGTQVRISEPVTIRRGGVLGFFAKLHYRIEVLPTAAAPAVADTAGPVEDEAAVLASLHAAPGRQVRDVTTAVPVVTVPAAAPRPPSPVTPPVTAASPLEALLEATEDEVDLATSRKASFDEILDKVASSLGDDPASLSSRLPAEPASTAPPAPQAPTPPAAVAEIPPHLLPPRGRHLRSTAPGQPAVEARPPAPPARHDLAGVPGPLAEQLSLLGFPPGLWQRAGQAPRSLHDAFSLAPAPRALPRTPGSLIAVVGSTPVAKRLAELCCVPAADVARARRWRAAGELPSARVVHDPYEAADLAPGWRRDRVAVVAVAVTSTGRDGAWAREVLRALAPSMTVVVASATTKPEDIAATCTAIGTADALVLEDVEATLSPAAALGAGIPVGMLDGLPADAANWLAVASRALARRGTGC